MADRQADSRISVYRAQCGNLRRIWFGQGNMFEDAPIAITFKGDTENRSGIYRDVDRDLESSFEASL